MITILFRGMCCLQTGIDWGTLVMAKTPKSLGFSQSTPLSMHLATSANRALLQPGSAVTRTRASLASLPYSPFCSGSSACSPFALCCGLGLPFG